MPHQSDQTTSMCGDLGVFPMMLDVTTVIEVTGGVKV